MKTIRTIIAAIALASGCIGSSAYADSIQQPGWSVGVPLGQQFPEGVYYANLFSAGGFRGVDEDTSALKANVPLLYWSTPWTIFNGKVAALFAAPLLAFNLPEDAYNSREHLETFNPALVAGPVWNLGDGWGLSTFVGLWFPGSNFMGTLGYNQFSFTQLVNLSYVKDGWKLAANLTYGITGDDRNTNEKTKPDYFNYDLTATKTIEKWEIGLAAFGSTDISGTSNPDYKRQAQFAIGGIVGYDFGPVNIQFYGTTDVYSENYLINGSKSYETRFWNRVIIPLGNPLESAAFK